MSVKEEIKRGTGMEDEKGGNVRFLLMNRRHERECRRRRHGWTICSTDSISASWQWRPLPTSSQTCSYTSRLSSYEGHVGFDKIKLRS